MRHTEPIDLSVISKRWFKFDGFRGCPHKGNRHSVPKSTAAAKQMVMITDINVVVEENSEFDKLLGEADCPRATNRSDI